MIEAYTIATRLTLKGDAQQKLARFIETVKRANQATEVLYRRLKPVNDQLLKASEISRKLNPSLVKMTAEFRGAQETLTSTNRTFSSFNSRIGKAVLHTDKFSHKIGNLTKELDALAAAGGAAMASLGGMGAAGAGLAVAGTARGHRRAGFHAKGVHAGFIGFNAPTLIGGVAAYTGYHTLKQSYHENKTYEQALARFEELGYGAKTNKDIDYFATHNAVTGLSYTDMLEMATDAAIATKHKELIKPMATFLGKSKFGNHALYRNVTNKQFQDLIKATELSTGSTDPEVLKKRADIFQKMFIASGGRINFSDIFNFVNMAGGAARYFTDDAWLKMEEVFVESKASGIGVKSNQFAKVLSAGTMTKAAAKNLMKLELLDKNGVEINPTTGLVTKINKGALKGADLAYSDNVEWVKQFWLPALKKHGITDRKAMEREGYYSFSNSNVARYISMIANLLMTGKIENSLLIARQAGNTESIYRKGLNISKGKEDRLSGAWDRLMLNLGKASSPAVLAGIDAITKFLETINALFEGKKTRGTQAIKAGWNFAKVAVDPLGALTSAGINYAKQGINSINTGSEQKVQANITLNIGAKKFYEGYTDFILKGMRNGLAFGNKFDPAQTATPPGMAGL